MSDRCANCSQPHPEIAKHDTCLLLALLAHAVAERGELTEEEAAEMLTTTNADALWDDLGPVVDRLVEGHYSEVDDD